MTTESKSKLDGFVVVDDKKVLSSWVCPDCGETVYVSFNDISYIGTPVCPECDVDCDYENTLIKK